jgi:hypothetical protein
MPPCLPSKWVTSIMPLEVGASNPQTFKVDAGLAKTNGPFISPLYLRIDLFFGHLISIESGDPECQETLSAPERRFHLPGLRRPKVGNGDKQRGSRSR